jgi:hypothetical protein
MLGPGYAASGSRHGAGAGRSAQQPWPALARRALLAAALSLALGLTLSHALIARPVPVATPTGDPTQAPERALSSLPMSTQAPIAAALGAEEPAYHIQTSPGGFEANNPVQRLTARFSGAGVQIASGKTRVGLSLRALGYGRSLQALGVAPPHARANRVTYAQAGIRLWYVNGPLGLEQGFSIGRAPSGPTGEELTLVLALSGDVHASLAAGGGGVTFSHAGGPSLLYRGLRINDARGRALSGGLELRNGSVLVRVGTRGARYPLRVDPFIQQAEKLAGSGQAGAPVPRLGVSVALSADGNTALVGGPGDYGKTGAAWVFTRSGSTWTQQGSKLTGGTEQGEGQFGSSVALSAAGNTALIGGPGDSSGLGAAWVFTRTGSTWTQQGSKLTGEGEVSSGTYPGQFGSSVALAGSESSATALVGGPGDNKGLGAAWAFTRSGSTWTLQGSKLTGGGEEVSSIEAPGKFGAAVALFATESSATALVGGPGDNKGLGAAWAFTRSGSTWTQQGSKLTGGEEVSGTGAPGEFGASVALASAEGNTALIGGPGDNKGLGAAWAFTRSGSTWTQQGSKLTGSGEVSGTEFPGEFGASVALASAEGNTALIGGPGDSSGLGAAWVFTRASEKWTPQGSKLTGIGEVSSTEAPGEFAAGVALSSDGNTGLAGGPGDNKGLGAAWAFTRSGSTWTQQGSKLTGSGASARSRGTQGEGVALSSDGNTALVGGPGDGVGAAWVFTRAGSTWTQQGPKLMGTEASSEARFGASVALSANGNTALVGGPGDSKGAGAAWAFTRSGENWSQQGAKLIGSGESGPARFGSGVALSSDGNTAAIGGPLDSSGAGAVWAFTRASEKWSPQGAKLVGTGASGAAHLGRSVALSSDGNTALAGGPLDSAEVGAAWAFTRSGSTWSQQAKLTPSGVGGALPPLFGESVALSSDGNTALIGGPYDEAANGAAWAFTRSGSTWSQQAKLTGSGMTGIVTGLGTSVALSSDGNTALAGGPLDNGEAGAVWVFRRSGSTWTQEGSKLTAAGASGSAQFGAAVALSAVANIGLIGGPTDYAGTGAAWVLVDKPPSTETTPASSITQTSATLNASVNPNGEEVSECKLEYGTTTAYGSSAPCTPSPGSGESAVAVSAAVGGLSPNTTYHFRVTATNAGGTSKGEDKTFATLPPNPPTVATGAATSLTRTLATLNGTVNPNGSTVSDCHFDYGPTSSYGSTAPCATLPGSGESAVAAVASLGNLSPNTTYHFRLSATNAGGTSTGSDQTFTTLTALPTPHWYKNAAKILLGEKSQLIGWGTLTLESSAGTATCRSAEAANVENTATAATKEVVLFSAWECKPVAGSCAGGEQRATPRHLPWQGTMLEEGVEGSEEFREEGWGIELNLECFKGGVNTANQLFKTGPVLAEAGTSTPAWINGTSATKPSEAFFDASSGHLYAEVEKAAVKGTTKGKLKFVGYLDNAPVPLIALAKP